MSEHYDPNCPCDYCAMITRQRKVFKRMAEATSKIQERDRHLSDIAMVNQHRKENQ